VEREREREREREEICIWNLSYRYISITHGCIKCTGGGGFNNITDNLEYVNKDLYSHINANLFIVIGTINLYLIYEYLHLFRILLNFLSFTYIIYLEQIDGKKRKRRELLS